MARKPRIHFPGALYHVVGRGNQGQKVFHEDRDFALYRQLLLEYKDRFRCSIYAYALMPNIFISSLKLHHPWSSYHSYLRPHSEDLVDTAFLLSQFSLKPEVARNRYRRFVEDRMDQGHRKDLYAVKEQRLLGDEMFIERIHQVVKEEAPHFYEVSLSELVSCVSSAFELPEEILYSSSRNRRGALGRALVTYLGRELGRYRLKDIAEHFKRDPSAISQGTRHIEEEIQKEGALSKTVQRVKEKLTRGRKKKYLIT